ncbi:aminoglycoside phosphotransferase family protein [Devosia salina]|uniref:Aminoglycoside phosphotransferase family protein n=1 Tax=Devosia salina TaxID=2860336 RepID=A0ABX8WCN1_9HYPH|nr:aminoglycoside phosphotransferase family protein [Devosia salina]QYO75736.1 aminoglycoside phosphotransferase family protein [Devosia salina]
MSSGAPSPEVEARITRILGWRPDDWRPVAGGYTAAARFRVSDERRSAFVKIATTPTTAAMLHREIKAYDSISAPFMPPLYGVDADTDRPMLVIEDLSDATWPPPWTKPHIRQVFDAIAQLHQTTAALPAAGTLSGQHAGWPQIARDPDPFLSLNLVTSAWLDRWLQTLVDAEAACVQTGDALVHLDLRSDNICIAPDGVKFIDWSEAGLGNPAVDLGGFLPSLAYEGGPLPDQVMPDAPEVAALISGYFAARAGQPTIPDAPFVRRVQQQQLSTAFPWAIRALGITTP